MNDYLFGTDVLGAGDQAVDVLGAGDQAVAIRFRDVENIVKNQGGAAGALAYKVAPQTITNEAYAKARDQIDEQMRAKGIAADVRVVSVTPFVDWPKSEFGRGAIVGVTGAGVLWAIWRFGVSRLFRR